ncbi:MAG: sulfotransferase family 2 domain-containing protein [Flavobacteriia bacterium]
MSENIFIHIPKTGGTTLNTAMNSSFWQTRPDFNYRHILSDKTSNSGDIFDNEQNDRYKDNTVFMIVRDPADRLLSEYFFIHHRKEYTDLLKPRIHSLEDYIQHPQTRNYMTGFLRGKRMYDEIPVTKKDLEEVIRAIEKIPVHVGIFERYADSLAYFSKVTGLEWQQELEIKRATLKRPKLAEVSEDILKMIGEMKALDVELYKFCVDRFNGMSDGLKGNYTFKGDKYNHLISFAARACLFEICMSDKTFIKQNLSYFRDLTMFLLNDLKIRDGRVLAETWNNAFLNAFFAHFPTHELSDELRSMPELGAEPIEKIYFIGETINQYYRENYSKCYRFKGMKFSKEHVKLIET